MPTKHQFPKNIIDLEQLRFGQTVRHMHHVTGYCNIRIQPSK